MASYDVPRGHEQQPGRGAADRRRYEVDPAHADQGDPRFIDDPFRPAVGPYGGRGTRWFRPPQQHDPTTESSTKH